ncbi:MAG: DUF58 domain-containing protein [Rhodospirillales bacterium]|nr:DUF58 domain-containing protein [Rhodospirillales bacterium]
MPDPRIAQQRAEQLASRLPPLLVAAERVASTVAQGVHGRRKVGQGETFWQFRRYEPGDSITRIDWRQTAKSDRVFVRETEWEAAQSVWLWRDASASMRWRSADSLPEKVERANLLVTALASLLIRGGEYIATFGESAPPATGRAALNRLAELIGRTPDHATAPAPSLPPPARLPRHAAVVLVGDFLSPLADIDAAVRRIAGRAIKGHIVQVLDPAEQSLPFAGRTRFEGMESEGEMLVPRVESVRADYQSALADHVRGLADIARAVGWTFMSHHTDRPPETALLALWLALAEAAKD